VEGAKEEVGRFVKENPDKFHRFFDYMNYCNDGRGEISMLLYPLNDDELPCYPDIDVKKVLSTIPDNEIISEFWAYDDRDYFDTIKVFWIEKDEILNAKQEKMNL